MGYPVNDHRPHAPQPEVCDLCGERWPAQDMVQVDTEGLRGYLICGNPRTGCARFRSAVSYKDRRRTFVPATSIGTGKSPVFPPGALAWWDEDENDAITN